MIGPRLVLASGSPRRRELLAHFGIPFEVVVSDFDEDSIPFDTSSPGNWVCSLATAKANTVAHSLEPHSIILGADTTVVLDGENLGKPLDADHAFRMLKTLSGRAHQVYTGVCCIERKPDGSLYPTSQFAVSHVTFDRVPDSVLWDYIATGEPLDKAGSYGIQGTALSFIPKVDGDYYNVVGLPLELTRQLLSPYFPNLPPAPPQPTFPAENYGNFSRAES